MDSEMSHLGCIPTQLRDSCGLRPRQHLLKLSGRAFLGGGDCMCIEASADPQNLVLTSRVNAEGQPHDTLLQTRFSTHPAQDRAAGDIIGDWPETATQTSIQTMSRKRPSSSGLGSCHQARCPLCGSVSITTAARFQQITEAYEAGIPAHSTQSLQVAGHRQN